MNRVLLITEVILINEINEIWFISNIVKSIWFVNEKLKNLQSTSNFATNIESGCKRNPLVWKYI
jgi:hypothetical protein